MLRRRRRQKMIEKHSEFSSSSSSLSLWLTRPPRRFWLVRGRLSQVPDSMSEALLEGSPPPPPPLKSRTTPRAVPLPVLYPQSLQAAYLPTQPMSRRSLPSAPQFFSQQHPASPASPVPPELIPRLAPPVLRQPADREPLKMNPITSLSPTTPDGPPSSPNRKSLVPSLLSQRSTASSGDRQGSSPVPHDV
jgi:hypothetical protein